MKKTNLTLKKKDFITYYYRKLTKDGMFISIFALLIFAIASIIYNPKDYYLLLIVCFFITLYAIKILKTIKLNENKPFSLSITNTEYEILRPDEKGKLVSTFFEKFKNFQYYDEYKNYIFIYVQKRMIFILNKDLFTNDEWNMLSKNIKSQIRYKKTNMFIVVLNIIVASMLLISMIGGFING